MVATVAVTSVPRRNGVAATIGGDFGPLVTVLPHQSRFVPARAGYEPGCPGVRSRGVRTALLVPYGKGDAGRIPSDDGPGPKVTVRFVDLADSDRRTPTLPGT